MKTLRPVWHWLEMKEESKTVRFPSDPVSIETAPPVPVEGINIIVLVAVEPSLLQPSKVMENKFNVLKTEVIPKVVPSSEQKRKIQVTVKCPELKLFELHPQAAG